MARTSAVSPDVSGRAADGSPLERPSTRSAFRTRGRWLALGIALAGILVGILAFAVVRETTAPVAKPAPAQSERLPARPPLTRAEEAYIQALWPIHSEVERSAVRMSLGKIFYKVNDMGRAELKTRVDDALATYRRAETRLQTLQPPPSLAPAHDDYVAAVQLFEKSALETLKMFDDGNDDHLLAAYPLSQEASNKIRAIGAQFWRDEFPPN